MITESLKKTKNKKKSQLSLNETMTVVLRAGYIISVKTSASNQNVFHFNQPMSVKSE